MLTLFKPFGSPNKEAALLSGIVDVVGLTNHGLLDDREEIFEVIKNCDILQADIEVLVTDKLLQNAKKLRAVVCRTIGVDFVDIEAADRRGILVLNSPDYCVNAVAEHVMALMFSLARNIPYMVQSMQAGDWIVRGKTRCIELGGKTIGIAGFGKIGRKVAALAQGLGMNVLATDPYVSPADAEKLGVKLVPLEVMLQKSDVLTVHMPLTPENMGLIGELELTLLKEGAMVINVARGGIIDEQALAKALTDGRLSGAALDVFTREPPGMDHVLMHIKHPNLLTTPHMGWNSDNARKINDCVFVEQITDLSKGNIPKHVVNPGAVNTWASRFIMQK